LPIFESGQFLLNFKKNVQFLAVLKGFKQTGTPIAKVVLSEIAIRMIA